MNFKKLAAAALFITGIATSSQALTHIKCTKYTIVLPEELVIAAEIRAGSERAMRQAVCERSASATEDLYQEDNPHRISVYVEELDMASFVLVFIQNNEDKPDTDN